MYGRDAAAIPMSDRVLCNADGAAVVAANAVSTAALVGMYGLVTGAMLNHQGGASL